MSDDKIVRLPVPEPRLGLMQPASLESELDPCNPFMDSLHALLKRRAELIQRYTAADASVSDVEREICERLTELSGLAAR